MTDTIRVQLISEEAFVDRFESATGDSGLTTERHALAKDGQNFGLVEVAALIVVAKSVAELAKAIVEVWKATKLNAKVTVKTPKGSITVEGDSNRSVDELVAQLTPLIR